MRALDGVRRCPLCGGAVGEQADGTLFPHGRYGFGCGMGVDMPHDVVPCLGELLPARQARS